MTDSSNQRPFAVVTGASSGIGYALAEEFAQRGYDLLVAAEDDGIHAAAQRLAGGAGTTAEPCRVDLATYKAFLYSFAEAIRDELRDSGVTVTALLPGATDTNFFARAGMEDTKLGQSKKDDPARVAREGVEALLAGEHRVVAGAFKNKAQVAASKVTSEPTRARVHRKMSEPGSGNR